MRLGFAVRTERISAEALCYTYHHLHELDVTAFRGKASQLLGWWPLVTFAEGMARLVFWYEENRVWARETRMQSPLLA